MSTKQAEFAELGTISGGPKQEIFVLFTDLVSTAAAMRAAARWGRGLCFSLRVLVLECVPYPLPLEAPPVHAAHWGRRFEDLRSGTGLEEASAEVRLCRDAWEGLRGRLPARSIVMIGKRHGWWPRGEDRLARRLLEAGHIVMRAPAREGLAHA